MPLVVSTVLFTVQKYNPTPVYFYSLEALAKKLYGKVTDELKSRTLDAEVRILETMDYTLEFTTTYDLLGFLAEVADLHHAQLSQAMHLITLAAVSSETRIYSNLEIAAAATCMVLNKAHKSWS